GVDGHNPDLRADVYGLGATFYYLLAGQSPFGEGTVHQKLRWEQTREPRPIREVRPGIPEGLAAVVARMTAKEPSRRHPTMAEVAEALARWTQEPIPPPPEDEMPRYGAALRNAGLIASAGPAAWAGRPHSPPPSPAQPPRSWPPRVCSAADGTVALAAESLD